MSTPAENGLVQLRSSKSVDEVVAKLEELLHSKGIALFTVIDHSGEAAKAGLTMPPTKVVIFGNPKAGTPVMLAAPSVAIDLPLKILVAADAQGQTWISYNDPAYLTQRHSIPEELTANLKPVAVIAAAIAG